MSIDSGMAIGTGLDATLARIHGIQARIAAMAPRTTSAPASPASGDRARIDDGFAAHLARVADSLHAGTLTGAGPLDAATSDGRGDDARTPFDALFAAATARHRLPAGLLEAVARVESSLRPDAVSHAGAQGLMQLMPATARAMGVTDPFDPAQAVDGAARLLRLHLDRFGERLPLAIAAYHAGGGAVDRHGGIPPFPQTQAYVPKVLTAMEAAR